jgi:phosphomannomutase
MQELFWKSLQSGTDIRGVAVQTPGQEVALTDTVVERIADAFLVWLCESGKKDALRIAVGHDSRISAGRIQDAVVRALTRGGAQVYDCGLASTPAMFMAVLDLPCDASIQITASHHPYDRNGLKFFTKDGALEADEISCVLNLAFQGACLPLRQGGLQKTDYMHRYAGRLRQMVIDGVGDGEKPLSGFHIVVDAGNGAGGFYAHEVLSPLGANTAGSQFLEPDGLFPNHIPNPENGDAMRSVSEAVVRAGADLGVIFDTDVDRAALVDREGHEINRNRLVALASAIALEGHPGGTIVTDSITSSGLKTFLEERLGGVHHRYKRGYKNVINEALRLNQQGIDCPLAIETSGHAALRENYFLDDGAYLATKLIIKMAQLQREGRRLEDMLEGLQEPVESLEVRLPILETDFKACGERVIKQVEAYAAAKNGWCIADDSREGVRVSFADGERRGWFLLRLSVHDPIMPLNIESDVPGGAKKILSSLSVALGGAKGLDLAPLNAEIRAE